MKPPWLLAFPRSWRSRYGDELVEQLLTDRRRMSKWADVVRTAAGVRWEAFRSSPSAIAVVLMGSLAVVAGCDLALGVGMDERVGTDLLHHWWGAPFVVALTAAAAGLLAGAVAGGHRLRRRLAG